MTRELKRRLALLGLLLPAPVPLARAEQAAPPSEEPLPVRLRNPTRPAPAPVLGSWLARETVAAALRSAGHPAQGDKLGSLAARTRSAALLPELSLRASHSTDQSLRLTPTLEEPDRYSQSGGAGVVLEVRLGWQLDRLLYDRDELAVLRLGTERAAAAGRVTAQVLELLFSWHRETLLMHDERLEPEAREAARLAALEAELTLDVLTGGWFGRRGGFRVAPRATSD